STGSDVSDDEGVARREDEATVFRGNAKGPESATGIEAEPTEPEKRGADHHHGDVVRLHRLTAVTVALAVEDCGNQGRHTGVDVDDGATGEVEGLDANVLVGLGEAAQPAADTPDP